METRKMKPLERYHPESLVDEVCKSSDVTALEARLAERDALIGEMAEGLRPFANYACGSEERNPCDCHNCKARALLLRAQTAL